MNFNSIFPFDDNYPTRSKTTMQLFMKSIKALNQRTDFRETCYVNMSL
jgi:hypothetical protein